MNLMHGRGKEKEGGQSGSTRSTWICRECPFSGAQACGGGKL